MAVSQKLLSPKEIHVNKFTSTQQIHKIPNSDLPSNSSDVRRVHDCCADVGAEGVDNDLGFSLDF
jgi:hypothetical protein